MKKFNLFLLLAAILTTFTACNDGDDTYYNVGMGTLQKSEQMYSIDFDNAESFNVPDSSLLVYKKLQNPGQRVVAMFNIVQQGRSKRCIQLRDIYGVLTKDFTARPTTPEEDQEIGNDVVSVARAWIAGGYLNIKFSVPTGDNTSRPHIMNAFLADQTDADGDLLVDFRHNLNGNYPRYWGAYSYVSFPVDTTQVKGYKLRYKYSKNETRTIKVD